MIAGGAAVMAALFLSTVSYYEGVPGLRVAFPGKIQRSVDEAKRGMVSAAELARLKAERDAAIAAVRLATQEAGRARVERDAIDEARRVTEAHVTRLSEERKVLSDELLELARTPVSADCGVDAGLVDRLPDR